MRPEDVFAVLSVCMVLGVAAFGEYMGFESTPHIKWLLLMLFAVGAMLVLSACERGPKHTELCVTLTPAEVAKRRDREEERCLAGHGGDWVSVCMNSAWFDLRCRNSYSIWREREEHGQCRECYESWDW